MTDTSIPIRTDSVTGIVIILTFLCLCGYLYYNITDFQKKKEKKKFSR